MELNVELIGDIAVATVFVDELDAGNTAEFKQQIAPLLAERLQVVLDLGPLRFIDSSGLGAMLSCLRQLREKGGELKLCQLSPPVRAAFELVRLHRILDIYPSRADAIRAFPS